MPRTNDPPTAGGDREGALAEALGPGASDLLRRLPEQAFLKSPEGTYLGCSEAFAAGLGRSVEGVIGRRDAELVSPERARAWAEADREVLRGGGPVSREEVVGEGEEALWLVRRVELLTGAGGAPLGLLGVVRDVTEARRAGEALAELQSLRDQFFDKAEEGFFEIGPDSRLRRWNPYMERITGLAASEVIGWKVLERFPFMADIGIDVFLQRALAGEVVLSGDHPFAVKPSGGRGWAQTLWVPVLRLDGNIATIFGTIRDTTDRVEAVRALREERQRTELALQGAALGTWDIDVPTQRAVYDDRLIDMLGYRRDEVEPTAAWVAALVHPEDRARFEATVESQKLGDGSPFSEELRFVHRAGHPVWILTRGRIVERTPDGQPLRACGTHLDITARKEAEAERAELEEQLRQAQKMEAIGQLAGGMAHDFNNILQGIIGYVYLTLPRVAGDRRATEFLEEALSGAQRAATLTNQLLAFSRRQVLSLEPVDLGQLVDEMLTLVRPLIGEHVELVFERSARPSYVRCDRGLLGQVLVNLCVNARDALGAGGTLRIATEPVALDAAAATSRGLAPGAFVSLAVDDSGTGMTEEVRARAFEPFFTTKGPGGGSGLGLSMTYGIVQQHGGAVTVESELGVGTRVEILLPAAEGIPSVIEDARARTAPGTSADGSETILVGEDDQAVRDAFQRILENAGYRVLVAPDGAAAVERFRGAPEEIDLVLLDVVMPAMSGREAREAIVETREVPVLFCSGYSNEALDRGLSPGEGVDLIQKPCSPDELLTAVRRLLDADAAAGR